MNALSAFGLLAVTAMLVCYALEQRSTWFTLAFAGSCALGSAYGFLQGAWPFGLVEAVWALVALRPVVPPAIQVGFSTSALTTATRLVSQMAWSNVAGTHALARFYEL
jgi:hypothetical protein